MTTATVPTIPARASIQKASPDKPPTMKKPPHDAVAKRAFEIYVNSGCKLGLCEQNWYQAERELTAQG